MKKRAVGALLIGILALSGCASASPQPQTPPSEGSLSDTPPEFSGAFAADLRAAWVDSESDFVRAAITDQVVDDQEWAELSTRMESCLGEQGIRFDGFGDDGTYSTGPLPALSEEEIEKVLVKCENWSGETWLHRLRRSMNSNPSNAPFAEVMTACLIRNDLVPADYSTDDFLRDNETLSFPFMGTADEETFWSCNSDPSYEASK